MDTGEVRQDVIHLLRTVQRAPDQPFPGGVSDTELADLQNRLGATILPSLADWLRVSKGEAIGPGGVYGARPDRSSLDIAAQFSVRPNWQAQGWLPVAGDGCGSTYVLVTRGELAGSVGFVDAVRPDEIDYIAATHLWLFVRFLLLADAGDRRWPFNERAVLNLDPAMAGVPAELLPWAGES
jgi:hypothetical protein